MVVMVVSLSPLGRLQVRVRVVAEHGTRFLREVVATVKRFKIESNISTQKRLKNLSFRVYSQVEVSMGNITFLSIGEFPDQSLHISLNYG